MEKDSKFSWLVHIIISTGQKNSIPKSKSPFLLHSAASSPTPFSSSPSFCSDPRRGFKPDQKRFLIRSLAKNFARLASCTPAFSLFPIQITNLRCLALIRIRPLKPDSGDGDGREEDEMRGGEEVKKKLFKGQGLKIK